MDFHDNKPIYLQLADQLMDEVERSVSLNGRRLPSVRDYASATGVNANTVMRTYTWLQQEGIIYNQRGIGYFYSADARERVLAMRRKLFFEKEIKYFMDRLISLQITPEDFNVIFSRYTNGEPIKDAISGSGE